MSAQRELRPPGILDHITLAMTAALLGSSFVAIEVAVRSLTPWVVVSGRCIVAALCLTVVVGGVRKTFRNLGAARVIGVSLTMFVLPYLCFAYGEQHVSAAQVSVLVSLGPPVSALVAHLATADERIGILDVGRLAVGLACVGWAVGIDVHAPIAWVAALSIVLALVSYAVGGVCIRMWSSRATPLEMATAALVVASVVSVIGAVRTFDFDSILQAPMEAHLSVLWLGIGPTATAFALRFRQTAALGVRYVAFAGWLMPLFGLGLAALFSGDTLEWPMVFGVVLVLALVMGQRRRHDCRSTTSSGDAESSRHTAK